MSDNHEKPNPTVYVLGFAFDHAKQAVCLIEKQKPDWQKGYLNGVGGKCEDGEMPATSMSREFFEETGVKMAASEWHRFITMRFGNGAVVHCYTANLPEDQVPKTMEAEEVGLWHVGSYGEWPGGQVTLPIDNLRWLIPMAYHELIRPEHERLIVDHDDENARRYLFIRNQKESLYDLIPGARENFGMVDLADFDQFDALDAKIDRILST